MSILRTLLLVVPLTIAPKIFHQIAFPRAGNAFWSHPLLLLLIKALDPAPRRLPKLEVALETIESHLRVKPGK